MVCIFVLLNWGQSVKALQFQGQEKKYTIFDIVIFFCFVLAVWQERHYSLIMTTDIKLV